VQRARVFATDSHNAEAHYARAAAPAERETISFGTGLDYSAFMTAAVEEANSAGTAAALHDAAPRRCMRDMCAPPVAIRLWPHLHGACLALAPSNTVPVSSTSMHRQQWLLACRVEARVAWVPSQADLLATQTSNIKLPALWGVKNRTAAWRNAARIAGARCGWPHAMCMRPRVSCWCRRPAWSMFFVCEPCAWPVSAGWPQGQGFVRRSVARSSRNLARCNHCQQHVQRSSCAAGHFAALPERKAASKLGLSFKHGRFAFAPADEIARGAAEARVSIMQALDAADASAADDVARRAWRQKVAARGLGRSSRGEVRARVLSSLLAPRLLAVAGGAPCALRALCGWATCSAADTIARAV
jgi:hypothetical protein